MLWEMTMLVSQDAVTKSYKVAGLKQKKYILTDLGAKSFKSRGLHSFRSI